LEPKESYEGQSFNGVITVAELAPPSARRAPGDVVCKPRGLPHAFWNPTDEPARLLDVITPGHFADYFREMRKIFANGGPDPEALMALAERYHLVMDVSSIPSLAQEHGLRLGP
jgi:hypothetical protein